MTPSGRRHRQHREIQAAAESGDDQRAVALAREHLAEFPGDVIVLALLATLVVEDNS